MGFYLPDECWESIFRFIINNDDGNLSSLSLVSKQFLSITNCLVYSFRVRKETRPFLPLLFKRFTNLNTLDLTHYYDDRDLDDLLSQISNFPLKLTSLKLPEHCTFPAIGFRAFSQRVTTLTSLNCGSLNSSHFLLIADCFPLLKELNLGNTFINNSADPLQSLLSKCRCIQHLDLRRTYSLNNKHVIESSLFLADLVSINLSTCFRLTESALFSLVRNCPSLSDIKMELTNIGKESAENSDSLTDIAVYPQLKSLYLGHNFWLSDESIVMFASIFPNLQHLDLHRCYLLSEGICQVLKRCCKISHLNLAGCKKVKLHGMNFVVPKLEVLNLSYTEVNDQTLYLISKNCCGLLELLLEDCHHVTKKGVKHVVENNTQLRQKIDKHGEFFSRHGCLLCGVYCFEV